MGAHRNSEGGPRRASLPAAPGRKNPSLLPHQPFRQRVAQQSRTAPWMWQPAPGRPDGLEAASRRRLEESFSDCASCPEMVTVPGGQTLMGSRPESSGYRPEEGPAHRINVHKPFAVSKHGISAENWRACVDAGICRPILASYLSAGPGVPATRVSWFDAKTYVEWLSKSSGRHYRLLSEAEWEYMAHAGKATDPGLKLDRQAGRGGVSNVLQLGGAGLKQLGETKPNAWGVHPLPANLLEWVEDCWHPNYAQAPQDAAPWLSGGGGDCAYRVVRGVSAAGGEFGGRRLAGRAREFRRCALASPWNPHRAGPRRIVQDRARRIGRRRRQGYAWRIAAAGRLPLVRPAGNSDAQRRHREAAIAIRGIPGAVLPISGSLPAALRSPSQ